MKINVIQELKQLNGSPLETGSQICPACRRPVGESRAFLLREVCTNALMFSDQRDQPTGGEKVERYQLALLIQNNDSLNVKAKDITLLQEQINKAYPNPLIVAQAWAMLEGVEE